MKQFRRRTARAILVPIALFVIVLGCALPASAAPLNAYSADTTPDTTLLIKIGPFSLSW